MAIVKNKFQTYKLGVLIEGKVKWLNLYDYKYNAFASKQKLNEIGFKKEEIIIKTKRYE